MPKIHDFRFFSAPMGCHCNSNKNLNKNSHLLEEVLSFDLSHHTSPHADN